MVGARWRTLPTGIWALGVGSLFMDTSSELIHSVLPIFMDVMRHMLRGKASTPRVVGTEEGA